MTRKKKVNSRGSITHLCPIQIGGLNILIALHVTKVLGFCILLLFMLLQCFLKNFNSHVNHICTVNQKHKINYIPNGSNTLNNCK